jgi:hypothetical protein
MRRDSITSIILCQLRFTFSEACIGRKEIARHTQKIEPISV